MSTREKTKKDDSNNNEPNRDGKTYNRKQAYTAREEKNEHVNLGSGFQCACRIKCFKDSIQKEEKEREKIEKSRRRQAAEINKPMF